MNAQDTPVVERSLLAKPSLLSEIGRVFFRVLKTVGNLRLTVTLFSLSVIMIFFGTVAQKNNGIWTVVDQYFWSWYVIIDFQLTIQFLQIFFGIGRDTFLQGGFPFPAGKTIGGLMFVNLVSAHTVQLINLINVTRKQTKKANATKAVATVLFKRSGIYILHAGLLLLFVGEYITREYQVEQNMFITEGGTSTYAFETRTSELAFITPEGTGVLRQIVIPHTQLVESKNKKSRITHADLPVDVEVIAWYNNSSMIPYPVDGQEYINLATAGVGLTNIGIELKESSGTDIEQTVDSPSAYIRLISKSDQSVIGTYLVSTNMADRIQSIQVNDRIYEFDLRPTRHYKPYTMRLDQLTFERYPGTEKPKNFASKLAILHPDGTLEREVVVSMNNPLSFQGETYFQHQMSDKPQSRHTVLQVVRNPGKYLPYASCVMVTLGLLIHFIIGLNTFLQNLGKKSQSTKPSSVSRDIHERIFGTFLNTQLKVNQYTFTIPAVSCVVVLLYVLWGALPTRLDSNYHLGEFGRLPVLKDGRVKPLDTVARLDMRQITTREYYKDDQGHALPAIRWYLEAASTKRGEPSPATKYKIFRIENDRLWELLNIKKRNDLRYSVEEISPRFGEFDKIALNALEMKATERGPFEQKTVELRQHLGIFVKIVEGEDSLLLPPMNEKEWRTVNSAAKNDTAYKVQALTEALEKAGLYEVKPADMTEQQREQVLSIRSAVYEKAAQVDPAYTLWSQMMTAYRAGKPDEFNAKLAEFSKLSVSSVSSYDSFGLELEHYLNDVAFYYMCTYLYGIALTFALAGLLLFSLVPATAEGLRRAAFLTLMITLVLHTITLIARMYLMDRPLVFVTNLYSSAVFIGWAGVIGSILIERIFCLNIGNLVGSFIGIGTCIIAHNLAATGSDTLEMMQAVLDTNFWLATHVTTVSLGYSATYMAGIVGILYLVLGIFTELLKRTPAKDGQPAQDLGRKIGQILYGVICFALLFSFVGTVLGGIWADYSWGRFWGWDPKENGAVLIVVWNALILHSRWAGLVKDRGMAVLSLVGSMITTWSWFGTNLLSVGLHTYGFREDLQIVCISIWVSHVFLIAGGMIPRRWWVSYDGPTA